MKGMPSRSDRSEISLPISHQTEKRLDYRLLKSSANRNFEAGILTDEPGFIDSAMSHFDSIWEGTHCKKCGRKEYCGDCISL